MPVNKKFFEALNEYCEDAGYTKEQILEIIEKGILNAYKKEEYGVPNARVIFNEETNEVTIAEYYEVVAKEDLDPEDPSKVTLEVAKTLKRGVKLGDKFELKKKVKPEDFNRISASSTKQIMNQEIKKLDREKAFAFFNERVDEMVVGIVSKIDDRNVYFMLDMDMSARVNRSEFERDSIKIGDKVNLYLSKVEMGNKGPVITVSRSDKNLIKRMFENNIPEIKDGVIEIVGIARDPGDRTKVCVKSLDENVDALGSCLGPKSSRIRDIINALGGEKIDLYEYSSVPKELIINALKPAEVIGTKIDEEHKSAIAIVPDDQFSLAIGKKGQNVRLAVQSSGWKIDIKNVTQALEEGLEF